MTRRRSYLILLLLLALMLGGCQGTARSAGPASPTPSSSPDYRALVGQARQAFQAADYAQALDLARQAITANPGDNTAWELYRQASIAQAADEYLRTLPDHRYRLPVEVFVRDQVNHTKDWFIVDVREPEEYAAGHIEGAVNIPLRELMRHLDELPNSRTAPILVYCHSQKRATHALVILHELGYLKAYNLQGGYAAYQDWLQHHPLPTPGPTPTPAPEEPDFGC
ncbi:MAG: rhodanese-like domain-containing protein [Chloroflexi bacterium]|nr:MAG: rhodanese-like domain-containing protein [Chloroflexota bacterium]